MGTVGQQSTGLRQRRNKSSPSGNDSSWTIIEHPPADGELLPKELNCDPIELFGGGLSPKELREAQKNARKALEVYVELANDAAAILSLLPTATTAENTGAPQQ